MKEKKKIKNLTWSSTLKNKKQKTKIMASRPITSWHIEREKGEPVTDFIFLGSKITVNSDWNHEIKRRLFLGRKAMTNLDSILKSRVISLPTKVHIAKAMVFPVVMYRCESWTIKKAEGWRIDAFKIMVLEKTLQCTLDYKEIKPVNPKGDQLWIFIGSTDAEAEAPILWPPDTKNRLIGKDPSAGKDWGQEEQRATEDEMARWHHWLNRYEFEQTPGDSKRQGNLVCYSPWGSQRVRHDRNNSFLSMEVSTTLGLVLTNLNRCLFK